MSDLGLFGDDPAFASAAAAHERLRLEQIWREGRSRHSNTCRSCGASLSWLVTEAGKWMPVDATPDARGNVAIEHRGCAQVARVITAAEFRAAVTRTEALPRPRYFEHHATCPNADEWRRA